MNIFQWCRVFHCSLNFIVNYLQTYLYILIGQILNVCGSILTTNLAKKHILGNVVREHLYVLDN